MGYYVNLQRSTVVIPAGVRDEVLKRWKELNDPKNDHLKNGGSYSGGKKNQSWYSWMSPDYDKECNSPEDVLKELGFDVETDEDGNISMISYDSKTGQEDLFFKTIADLIPAGQYMGWQGEDGAIFIWLFDGSKMNETAVDVFYIEPQFLEETLA